MGGMTGMGFTVPCACGSDAGAHCHYHPGSVRALSECPALVSSGPLHNPLCHHAQCLPLARGNARSLARVIHGVSEK